MEKFLAGVKYWHQLILLVLLVIAVLARCGCVTVQKYEPHPLEFEPIDVVPHAVNEFENV